MNLFRLFITSDDWLWTHGLGRYADQYGGITLQNLTLETIKSHELSFLFGFPTYMHCESKLAVQSAHKCSKNAFPTTTLFERDSWEQDRYKLIYLSAENDEWLHLTRINNRWTSMVLSCDNKSTSLTQLNCFNDNKVDCSSFFSDYRRLKIYGLSHAYSRPKVTFIKLGSLGMISCEYRNPSHWQGIHTSLVLLHSPSGMDIPTGLWSRASRLGVRHHFRSFQWLLVQTPIGGFTIGGIIKMQSHILDNVL